MVGTCDCGNETLRLTRELVSIDHRYDYQFFKDILLRHFENSLQFLSAADYVEYIAAILLALWAVIAQAV
jgi:hypothetical protein